MSKFYNEEWYTSNGWTSPDQIGFSSWEAAGAAEDLSDAVQDLIEEYKQKYGDDDLESAIEVLLHPIDNGFYHL